MGYSNCKDCGINITKWYRGERICDKCAINDAQHPSRQKAIEIMEFITTYLGKPKLFDCGYKNTEWYDIEDILTNIINRKN